MTPVLVSLSGGTGGGMRPKAENRSASPRNGNAGRRKRPAELASLLEKSWSHLLAERLYGGRFVVFHVEDGVELGDLQQVVDFLGEVEQLEFAALVFHCGVGADQ